MSDEQISRLESAFRERGIFSFNEELHEYRIGAHAVPACTHILSEGGLVNYSFVSQDILERKGELGREVHRACHLHNLGTLGEYDPRVQPHLDAWIKFKQQCHGFKLLSSEFQTVTSLNGMWFGMKLDCNALVDGADTIIELKIGEIYPHHAIQTAGYAAGLPHAKYTSPMARFVARKRIGVELRANGVPKLHRFEDKSDFDVFASLLFVASWKRRNGKFYEKENS